MLIYRLQEQEAIIASANAPGWYGELFCLTIQAGLIY